MSVLGCMPARLHRAKLTIKLDISTGDPIWPAPESIDLPSLLGGSVKLQGHPLVTVIAEKTRHHAAARDNQPPE